MARELPIHNGRMTTDLDANGFRIKNLSGRLNTVAWSDVTDKPTFSAVATSGSYNDLSDKPTIPAPVDISGKLDGEAAYPAWQMDPVYPYQGGAIVSHLGRIWQLGEQYAGSDSEPGISEEWDDLLLQDLIDLKQDALSAAQMDSVNSGATAAKVATWDGYAAQIAQKADASDLPYAMVTPGEWVFSGSSVDSGKEYKMSFDSEQSEWNLYESNDDPETPWLLIGNAYGTGAELSVEFDVPIAATRASLPGHLLDRANNLIDATTGDVTLTLPAYQEGKVRDLLVHVNLGDDGTNPHTVTVNFPSGETNTGFKVKGNASAPIPAPDAVGEWLFSFSESSPHKMAVSLAQLQDATVAGGS